jgi:beta-1,4-mannosyltransferase
VSLPHWSVVTDYPRWPSPYFQQFEAALAPHLDLRFSPVLPALGDAEPGVVNLHRLARLYRGQDRRPDAEQAHRLLSDLDALQVAGWSLVWTVHNLYPIYTAGPTIIDRQVAEHLLANADMLITHTAADAAYLAAAREPGSVVTAGSAGLDAITDQFPSPQIRLMADFLSSVTTGLLVLGNLADYKGLPQLAGTFLSATRDARLVLAGRPSDPGTARDLAALAADSNDRILLHAELVPPGTARYLCSRATALLAPYRTDGAFSFFRHVLHPSSVAMAVGFGTPILAPDLPSIRELTEGHPRTLYQDSGELADSLARLDRSPRPQSASTGRGDRWPAIAAAYSAVASSLASQASRSLP